MAAASARGDEQANDRTNGERRTSRTLCEGLARGDHCEQSAAGVVRTGGRAGEQVAASGRGRGKRHAGREGQRQRGAHCERAHKLTPKVPPSSASTASSAAAARTISSANEGGRGEMKPLPSREGYRHKPGETERARHSRSPGQWSPSDGLPSSLALGRQTNASCDARNCCSLGAFGLSLWQDRVSDRTGARATQIHAKAHTYSNGRGCTRKTQGAPRRHKACESLTSR